jgi:hypothetical protein
MDLKGLVHSHDWIMITKGLPSASSSLFCCSEGLPKIPDCFTLKQFLTLLLSIVLAGVECYEYKLGESLRTLFLNMSVFYFFVCLLCILYRPRPFAAMAILYEAGDSAFWCSTQSGIVVRSLNSINLCYSFHEMKQYILGITMVVLMAAGCFSLLFGP